VAALTSARGALLVAALLLPLTLTACIGPGSPSTVTLTFELEGAERSLTLRPDAHCTETGVTGLSNGGDPAGQINFLDRSLDGTLGSGSGAIEDGAGLVRFDADEIELDRTTAGVVEVAATPVAVVVFADRAESGPAYDEADGVPVDGVVTAHLVCAE